MSVPIIVGQSASSASGIGVSLVTYRRRLADELGIWHQTYVSATAAGSDPSRVVLADELRDDEAGYNPLDSALRPAWLYVRSGAQAGVQRRLLQQADVGYQGSHAALVVSRPFAAPLEAGSLVEVTAPLPVKRAAGIKGLDDCVNEALDRLWVEARVSMIGNGTHAYDLSDHPYLWDPDQLVALYDHRHSTETGPAQPEMSGSRSAALARCVVDGPTRQLLTESVYGQAEPFWVQAIVRASHLTFDGAAWAYDTTHPGLHADDHLASCPEQWVLTFGVVKALQFLIRYARLAASLSDALKPSVLRELEARLRVWAAAARRIQAYDLPSYPRSARSGYVVATTAAWA